MVEVSVDGLLLYRPVVWCFVRGMKKPKTSFSWWKKYNALVISIFAAVVITNLFVIPWVRFWGTETEIDYYRGGSYWETPYRFFMKHGTAIGYKDGSKKWEHVYENGSKRKEIGWVDGKRHGREIWYSKDGSKRFERTWVNGVPHGTQIDYREDGSKSQEIVYENGKEISRKEF